jgi:hypothetical protein
MNRRAVLFAAALALMSLASSSAQAAGTVVFSDSGNIGPFTMTNTGIDGGGTATILITLTGTSAMNTVNGGAVPAEPATFQNPITLHVTPNGLNNWTLALVPATYTKTIGTVGANSAILNYNLATGATSTALPDFFNASGKVTSVSQNADPLYDFTPFKNGSGAMNDTFTATEFAGGATSFATLFTTLGGVAVGNGAFSQIAFVPEPGSFALLGIGMTGFLAFRRFLKRKSD